MEALKDRVDRIYRHIDTLFQIPLGDTMRISVDRAKKYLMDSRVWILGHEVLYALTARDNMKIGYMDLTDFDYEVGHAPIAKVYSDPELADCPGRCGIVEVEVRMRKIVKEPSPEEL